MKALAIIGSACAASACCIGPVVFSLLGAGALSAASVKLEVFPPWFLGFTVVLMAVAFYSAYSPGTSADSSCEAGVCDLSAKRTAQIIAWMVAAVALLLIAFPYYIGYLM